MEGTQVKESYLAQFARFAERLNGSRSLPLHGLRQAGIRRFEQLGFPTTRDEEWKYTSVAPIARTLFRPAEPRALDAAASAALESVRRVLAAEPFAALLVFLNGRFAPELSSADGLPDGVRVSSLAAALEETPEIVEQHLNRYADLNGTAFAALNTAFIQDGAFVHLPRGMVLEPPIHVVFLASPGDAPEITHPRNLIVCEEQSQATVIESYVGAGDRPYFTNAVTEIAACENSVLEYYKIQQESLPAFHVATVEIRQARSSTVTNQSVTLGSALTRNDINAILDDEGAECTLNGLYLGVGRQHIDNHTRIDHAKPHCDSHELYKGILDGAARGVFNGKIYVHPDAQKTDAKQTNKTLLLSQDAALNTKPQLEIFADDVRCTHGATVGQLDEDSIFYLRSRGIPEMAARGLLTYAFASEILEQIKTRALREHLERLIFGRLSAQPGELPGEGWEEAE